MVNKLNFSHKEDISNNEIMSTELIIDKVRIRT
jgi:hypothetical protein